MATAPSFANLERLSEPFEENGKEYILFLRKKENQDIPFFTREILRSFLGLLL